MAELKFFYGTMGCGKSTLALQNHHQQATRNRRGVLYTKHDRAGAGIRSRIGPEAPAVDVDDVFDIAHDIGGRLDAGERIDYIICDEAQFLTDAQVEQLAHIVDHYQIPVYAFGLITDFRSKLFAGSQRMLELADQCVQLQVEALCWCGKTATQNARIVDGEIVRDGDIVVTGDVTGGDAVTYDLLCRNHYITGQLS